MIRECMNCGNMCDKICTCLQFFPDNHTCFNVLVYARRQCGIFGTQVA